MQVSIAQIVAQNEAVKNAYDFAKKIHHGERRKNGEPLFNHCLATAETLARWGLDQATIATGLIHDVPQDNRDQKSAERIKSLFSEKIAILLENFNQIRRLPYSGAEKKTDNLRKFILFLSKDIRVIFIKFASRLDNLRILYSYPEDEQKRMALEAIEIYAPLAHQLGMYNVAGELEDLAFPYIYPENHGWLVTNVREKYEEREKYLEEFKPALQQELEMNGVALLRIDSRAKHYFSLYKKLLRYDMDLNKIHDLVAVRLIVRDLSDCYTALGVIHKNWPPIPGRIKDYIASPKPNGYRSLHTTIRTPEGKTAEIQIRTEEMHQEAELGIAAHFAYRHLKGSKTYLARTSINANPAEMNLIKELRQFPKRLDEIEFFRNRILVLSPKGEVFDLPLEATPVDFAYKIHTDIGNRCIGAHVNGKMTALNSALQSGDIVEILTSKNKRPSPAWLEFIKTNQAREHIKAALHQTAKDFRTDQEERGTKIRLAIEDRPGLLKELGSVFTRLKIKVRAFEIQPKNQGNMQMLKIECADLPKEKLKKIHQRLKQFKEIKKIG